MRGIFRYSTLNVVFQQVSGFRCISTSHRCLAVDKGLLSKLRKQTGIPFINCKRALEKFDNDFDQAKQWLQEQAQKEGWARATKLQTRPMSQGLVAVMGDHRQAAMLEVNCETDFVARNDKFISMVSSLVQECHGHLTNQTDKKITLNKNQLGELNTSYNSKLADIVALNVGNMGENMALRRGIFLRASEDSLLCSYVHPSSPSQNSSSQKMGKYGAVVELCHIDGSAPSASDTSIRDLGSHLCQHIVGMNPKCVGEYVPKAASQSEAKEVSKVEGGVEEGKSNARQVDGDGRGEDEALLSQEFLLDASLTVGELAHSHGVEVKDFVRFACGEELDSEKE